MKIIKVLALLCLAVFLILTGLITFGVGGAHILTWIAGIFAFISGILTLGALVECRHTCCHCHHDERKDDRRVE